MHVAFDAIGHVATMNMPKSDSNHAPWVWEYIVSRDLESRAKKRRAAAERKLMDEGLLPDPEVNPRGLGKHDTVCSTDFAAITLEVRKGREVVNIDEMITYLRSKGVKTPLLIEAREFATTHTRPSHVFTPIWLTDENSTGK
jgi:hypothetical protein